MTAGSAPSPLSIEEIVERRTQRGGHVRWASGDRSYWIEQSKWMAVRMPPQCLDPVDRATRRSVLSSFRALALSYALEASNEHPANATHYVCRSPYGLDRLSANTRSKVRRGLKRFEVRRCSVDEVAEHGYQAATDTMGRVGNEQVPDRRQHRAWIERMHRDGYELWGAVHESGTLAAWAAVIVVDDWAILPVERSRNDLRSDYPNNALLFGILDDLLGNGATKQVSYGWSSLQVNANSSSLHQFKLSMGFEADPVHRVITFRQPLDSIAHLGVVHHLAKRALVRWPDSYRVGKVAGLIGVEAASP